MSSLFGGGSPALQAPPPAAPALPKPESTALREQQEGQRAIGGGVQGTDNEASTLGFTSIKRKNAARQILG